MKVCKLAIMLFYHGNQWPHQAQIIDIDMDEGLQVGDDVIVENHGKYWPHKAQIINIDMKPI
jgi:hypothetical protein